MKVCGNTDIGKTRSTNEDDYCIARNDNGDWLARSRAISPRRVCTMNL